MEPQSVAVQIEQLKGRVSTMEKTMDQHFQSLEKLGTFVGGLNTWTAKHDEREEIIEEQQESRHRSNSTKLNLIGIFIAFSAVVVTIVGILITVYLAKHAEVDPAKIFHSYIPESMYANRRDSATIPALTR